MSAPFAGGFNRSFLNVSKRCTAFSKSYSECMARLLIPANDVKHWSPCSELHQDPGQQEQDKARHRRKRRFALIALQTSYFDWNFHDRTADVSACNLQADAAVDVPIGA
jgi:hypothetical protein